MITAENISYQEIIKDISFEIPDHGVVGLVGPNGSGKTTLLRTLFWCSTTDRRQGAAERDASGLDAGAHNRPRAFRGGER